jgi:hypothetical protein
MSKEKNETVLKEYKLSWAGKLFFAGVAAKLAGHTLKKVAAKMRGQGLNEQEETETSTEQDFADMFPFQLQGTPEQIQAVADVIKASKEYQEELSREGATVESVMQKLNDQNLAKQAFEQATGKAWPL